MSGVLSRAKGAHEGTDTGAWLEDALLLLLAREPAWTSHDMETTTRALLADVRGGLSLTVGLLSGHLPLSRVPGVLLNAVDDGRLGPALVPVLQDPALVNLQVLRGVERVRSHEPLSWAFDERDREGLARALSG